MSSKESKKYTINFGNRHFQINSTDGDQHIKELEEILAESYADVSSKNNSNLSQNSVKVSLKLADELVRLRRRINELNELIS